MVRMLPRIIGVLIALAGFIVMLGWLLYIPVLTSIVPTLISMKFNTALSFFLGGIMLYFLDVYMTYRNDVAQIIVITMANIILLLMGTLLVSFVFKINTGIEELFIKETVGAVATVMPGAPSVGAMIGFVLFASGGLLALTRKKPFCDVVRIFGLMNVWIGVTVLVGYAVRSPILEFNLFGSNPVAPNAAFLICLSGIGLFLLAQIHEHSK